jgi:hypothetical protein
VDTSPEERIKEFFVALNNRDLEHVLSFYLPDAKLTSKNLTLTGRDEIARFYSRLFGETEQADRLRFSLEPIEVEIAKEGMGFAWTEYRGGSGILRGVDYVEFGDEETLFKSHTTEIDAVIPGGPLATLESVPRLQVDQSGSAEVEGDYAPSNAVDEARKEKRRQRPSGPPRRRRTTWCWAGS